MLSKKLYNELVAKVNSIDTSRFVIKTKYDADKSELENKISDISGLVKKTDYNTEIDGKIPNVSNLATKTTLTTIENKILDVSNLIKKTDCNTKITKIENKLNNHNHDKYITTSEFNNLAADVFNARLAQANLVTKTDFDAKLSSLNKKNNSNKTTHLLVENELKKLKTFDSIFYRGKNHFEEDGTQNNVVFQPLNKYFKVIANTKYISSWKSKGLFDENITGPTTRYYKLNPQSSYFGTKTRQEFRGSCLKQDKITSKYLHSKYLHCL